MSALPAMLSLSGLIPLDITLKLTKSTDNSTYSLSYVPDNDSVENLGDNETSLQFKRRITKPGLYYITVDDTETKDNGTVINHADTISVMVERLQDFDAKLQGKWVGMKSGFGGQNIPSSLKYISALSNDKYREIFTAIADQLPVIAADMQNIELIIVNDNIAKYRIRREDTINGQTLPITYYIYFIKDMNGLWKIDKW
ncbi:MAG: hypothetical protein JW832_14505 [Deltaproteobacteria bacterium]|nr:hypothetical protein [Deltaproteobacteria bacterium]